MAHWTEELFVDSPELFYAHFEARAEHVPVEVDFILEKLKDHDFNTGRILDLNCGVGRHALELAKRGIEVVGTDISPQYVDIAAKKAAEANVAGKATFKVADMRQITAGLSGEKPFDGIICMWTAFGFYDDATNEDILRQCVGLLKPGGFFVMDIVNRDWLLTAFNERGHTLIGDLLVLEERNFDIQTSRMVNKWTYLRQQDGETYGVVKTVDLDHRVWSLHELKDLFEKVGLEHAAVYAGFGPGFDPKQPQLDGLRNLTASRMLLYIGRKP